MVQEPMAELNQERPRWESRWAPIVPFFLLNLFLCHVASPENLPWIGGRLPRQAMPKMSAWAADNLSCSVLTWLLTNPCSERIVTNYRAVRPQSCSCEQATCLPGQLTFSTCLSPCLPSS